ncbi:MAG: amino acid ABC transporter permease, partial [Deltaproteobacteria bacterium]|nr:amino acid ABC transporter permease [Deltaproteobacteria bacterium]
IIASETFKYTEIFMIIGAIYLFLTTIASWILHRVEDSLRLPGFEHYKA